MEAHGVRAVGLGTNKECYERGAYLAHGLTAGHEKLLHLRALPCDTLQPDMSRYDFQSQQLPTRRNCKSRLRAAVWCIEKGLQYRGYFDEDEEKVLQRFRQVKGGPYYAAVLDSQSHFQKFVDLYSKDKSVKWMKENYLDLYSKDKSVKWMKENYLKGMIEWCHGQVQDPREPRVQEETAVRSVAEPWCAEDDRQAVT